MGSERGDGSPAPAGWYWDLGPAPALPYPIRWWNGHTWTAATRWWDGRVWRDPATGSDRRRGWFRRRPVPGAVMSSSALALGVLIAQFVALPPHMRHGVTSVTEGCLLVVAVFTPVNLRRLRRPPQPPASTPPPPA